MTELFAPAGACPWFDVTADTRDERTLLTAFRDSVVAGLVLRGEVR